MQSSISGHHVNGHRFVSLLKACTKMHHVQRGCEVHAEIVRLDILHSNLSLGNALVHFYAANGLLSEAQEVFRQLPSRDVVSWTTLISGCVMNDRAEDALTFLQKMQQANVSPNTATFISLSKACGYLGYIDKAREVHAEIEKRGFLGVDVYVGNSLVDMYIKCGSLESAQHIYDNLSARDAISSTALITGFVLSGYAEEAAKVFEQMIVEGISLDSVAFTCIIKACGIFGAIDTVKKVHIAILNNGLLEKDLAVANTLIDAYAEIGSIANAEDIFFTLQIRDVVSWNAMIGAYIKHKHIKEAFQCIQQMQQEGILPDVVTFLSGLKTGADLSMMGCIKAMHARMEFLDLDATSWNSLVDAYATCGLLEEARNVFDSLPVRSVVAWTALLEGYANHGSADMALDCFNRMQLDGISPNSVTYVCILKACGITELFVKGMEIHCDIIKKGFLETDIILGNALIYMYGQCNLLLEAHEVFDKLCVRDMTSWNSLLRSYTIHNHIKGALKCFELMQHKGITPDPSTVVYILWALGDTGTIKEGTDLHNIIQKMGIVGKDLTVGNALVDIYAKCGLLRKAQEVFDELPIRDVVSWTTLISGYSQHGDGDEALKCYEDMQLKGILPDAHAFVSILTCCTSIGALIKGEEIHSEIARNGILDRDPLIGNALVNMYAKCGWPGRAKEVFEQLTLQDEKPWTALISGYAQIGDTKNASDALETMARERKQTDGYALLGFLDACSHVGQVHEANSCFDRMGEVYGMNPSIEHYNCMIDLFCRAGLMEKAIALINKMPFNPDPIVWCTVLGACQKWGNTVAAKQAFDLAVRLNATDASVYVCMQNIYSEMQI